MSNCQLLLMVIAIQLAAQQTLMSEPMETQLTFAEHGHVLTNTGVWSSDGQWIVYDVRSDAAGDLFDGRRIERVHVATGRTEVLFESANGAHCGVATSSPVDDRVVFIHGPEFPDDDWQYAAFHRRGVLVDGSGVGKSVNLDARNILAPYTPGALRGGTHVHTFSGDGQWIAFTYEDHVLANSHDDNGSIDLNQRNVGVSVPTRSVQVPSHRRNHHGSHFSVLVTQTHNQPRAGSNEISRAFSDAWIGQNGYFRKDGTRQAKAIAFQGLVRSYDGQIHSEVFVVDLPSDLTRPPTAGKLEGTERTRPQPPHGVSQRRLTFTEHRKYPGIQGVRHWLRSSPDGSKIAFLMKSDDGVSQLWTISPMGGQPTMLTENEKPIESAFSWSPDGRWIAHVLDRSICVTDSDTGETVRFTKPKDATPLRPEACVFSPDGRKLAYVRRVQGEKGLWNQVFVLELPEE